MKCNSYILGLATAAAVAIGLSGVLLVPAKRDDKPVQIVQSGQKPDSGGVYCYNGLKADQVDKWSPLYRGWVCIPARVN